ncbi:MAG: 4a-hydroxytetrahydrobiopterin dehydratase [Pseudomonadales bacterium]|nr:4a-hydroxytetrahydrobiopterin dehydratase [Pseudomonadales bacterium]
MKNLADQACTACRPGSPTVPNDEMTALLSQLPQWQLQHDNDIPQLRRSYRFPDFRSALAFTGQVGELAEAAQHHPAILTEWGRVTLSWWTHTIGGLHQNDFIMAARCDRLYPEEFRQS